ncbi:30S ribosomal protein S7 [Candidatus Woesebacteria bacterium RIFCSPHIGHO2_02_FULL_38_9]|uniref:Small ribosomal subunit protein uS7 n=1 Tax=Candidatus Woesebacteria bacterium RIFCSPHIGHO2_01_FULL_39_28 TaxID=1802496 RepID=A0A1F7YHG7_9BACT|nr:MAG: 30S ribosomal protein S7 [Candidatus Woesebacteria bacterium RIFCSPHIGHO2_01_FULL_39_28]OGM34324.1 MAG: 30S ribosomal protein S7 [Candidatus Woesebacteria bacterium RIFCSPHIGHO2_02_FULL_38_9]OGM58209.1 MAG: 30S ribosomal protein S7 [Candidatus Woesebacteria bacterium RIFCSPLOWO2_01_FULL_38_20]
MSRKGPSGIRKVSLDPIYSSLLVAKLINRAMKDGKKSVIQKEVYKAFDIISRESKEDPVKIFDKALENIKPTMEVRPRRVGGAAYQVPISVRGPRRESLGIRWLIATARARSNSEYHTFAEKLAAEILAAAKSEGGAVKKRLEVEKIAEANRAFAHFRW